MDTKKLAYRFHESILKAERLIKEVRVPRYDTIANSIKSKYISLIIRRKRYKDFLQRKEVNEQINGVENEDDEEEDNKEKVQFEKPETFKQRRLKNSKQLIESIKNKRKKSL